MKQVLTVTLLVFAIVGLQAQGKLGTKTAHIRFFSSTPIEDIVANNNSVSSVLDPATGKLEFAALIKGFQFPNALMQEHFNENYMDSDKFPKATFKGQIVDIAGVNFAADGAYKVKAVGDLTIHGVTKQIEIPATLAVTAGEVMAMASFFVAVKDYDVRIPTPVVGNIAKEIKIDLDANYSPLD